MAREYKSLEVWKRSVKFCKRISDLVDGFPRKEDWVLGSQMRRAVVSIPSNIAEGCSRNSSKDVVRFLYISLGSVNEVVTQLYIAREFGYVGEEELKEFEKELNELGKMLMGFVNYISGLD